MSLSATQLAPRGVGDLISATFNLFRKSLVKFASITAVVMVPYLLLSGIQTTISLVNASAGTTAQPGVSIIAGCLTMITLIIAIFVPWMDGALNYAAIERSLGRTPGVRASYGAVRSKFGSLWATTFIKSGVVSLLLMPLIAGIYGGIFAILLNARAIPGVSRAFDVSSLQNILTVTAACCLPLGLVLMPVAILLTLNWSMSSPVIVGEGQGAVDALRRSTAIVKGFRFNLLGRFIAMSLLLSVVFGIPLVLFSLIGLIPSLLIPALGTPQAITGILVVIIFVFSMITSLFQVPLRSIFGVMNYLDLRVRKDNLVIGGNTGGNIGSTPASNNYAGAPQATMSSAQPVYTAQSGANAAIAQLPPAAQLAITKDMTPAQRIGVLFNLMRMHGASADLLGQLGSAYQEVGDLGAALDSFTRAREADPRNADLAFNIMRLHLQRKDQPSARAAMADYLRLETNTTDLQNVLANPAYRDILPPRDL